MPDISSGLVAYFPFDGSAIDSVNNLSGTIHEVTATENRRGVRETAMHFSRYNFSYIEFPNHFNYSFPNNIFTINCWVKVDDTDEVNSILSKRGYTGPFEYSLDSHFNNSFFNFDNWVSSGSGSVYGIDPLKSSVQIHLNEWHMITYIADGTWLTVYSDANPIFEADLHNSGFNFSDSDVPLQFGVGGGWGVNYFFNGSIDDVSFYNRPLNQTQLKYIYRK